MKPSIKSMILLAIATAAISPQAFAQPTTGYEQTVTMSMTVYTTVDGTFEKDENGGKISTPKTPTSYTEWYKYNSSQEPTQYTQEWATKIGTWKVGNKEILNELVNAGVIPSIVGWSIKLVSENDGDPLGFFLVNKTGDVIPAGSYLDAWLQADAEDYKATAVRKYIPKSALSTRVSLVESGSYKETASGRSTSLMNVVLNTEGESFEFNLHGTLKNSFKYIQGTGDEWSGDWVSNGGSYQFVGSLDFPNQERSLQTLESKEDSSVVDGAWTFSPSKFVDISEYNIVF